jgi:hypothetical protein
VLVNDLERLDWDSRARMGRAMGVWGGGLDGPPPSWEELEGRARRTDSLEKHLKATAKLQGMVDELQTTAGAEAVKMSYLVLEQLKSLFTDKPKWF